MADNTRIQFLKGRVLDIGYVQTIDQFKDYDGELFGVDIQETEKPPWYRETKKANLNIEDIPYQDNFFDTVFVGDMPSRLSNPIKFLFECNRVLKTGGHLITFLENPHYYWNIVTTVFMNYFKFSGDQNFFTFTRYNVRTMLNKTGFKLVDEKGFGFTVIKLGLRFKMSNWPALAELVIYDAEKVINNPSHSLTVVTKDKKKIKINERLI